MSTKDELWQWLGEPLQELSRHRLEQPEAEWQETEAKARAVLRAAEMVEAGLSHGD